MAYVHFERIQDLNGELAPGPGSTTPVATEHIDYSSVVESMSSAEVLDRHAAFEKFCADPENACVTFGHISYSALGKGLPNRDAIIAKRNVRSRRKFHLTIGERLKLVREHFSLTQLEMAKRLSTSQSVLSNYERNERTPETSFLRRLLLTFHVNINWLLTGEGSMFVSDADDDRKGEGLDKEEYVFVPLLEGSVQAGPEGRLLFEPADMYPFKRWWIIRKVGPSEERHKHLVLVRVSGDSMIPTINPNEVILVDFWESERLEIKNGKIYLVRLPDGAISVKRVVLLKENQRLLCQSDNPIYEPFEFNIDPAKGIKWYILGRIRWVGREID